ncbi:GNAT family N-acetyltransferase [Exiguobacterium sp. SH1S21]|uniref:GNAT family N-acetyltransferase n=1 Tax=Exiguobacterium sp. SH1S21 TaxID=2510953 RepID=UPI001039C863|nr:GNAT family N-acetyltransferase [Exiguobacterium sp. SH1S21]TCI57271.1 GNAT family N-acetyltransferase [Exiguobacterium sp. SH1S21]
MKIHRYLELEIDEKLNNDLRDLLVEAFELLYPNRRYFKQLPHLRLLIFGDEDQVIGHVGLDYRMMNLNGEPIQVLGVIDLCVREEMRGNGIGEALLNKVINIGKTKQVDFLLLFADRPDLYLRSGFSHVDNACTWLQIDDERQIIRGIGEASFDELMIRPVGNKTWTDGHLDLMGYLY